MGDVVGLDISTTADLPPEKVLNGALAAKLAHCIVIGWGEGEADPHHAATTANIPEMLFRIEMFKRELLNRAAS